MLLLIRVSIFLFCIFGEIISQNIQDSIIAHYSFDGHANDVSTNNNHGTVVGAKLVQDRFQNQNSAYYFDGVDDYIVVNDNDLLTPTNNTLSIAVWAKIYYPGNKFILYKGSTMYNREYAIGLRADSLFSFQINNYGSSTERSGLVNEQEIEEAKWYHIVGVWNGVTQSIYIDGVLENISSPDINISNYNSKLFIGSYGGTISELAFNGIIDDIQIYNRALDSNEIEYLYTVETNFTADTTSGLIPLTVQFTEQSIVLDSTNKINNWQWDFDNDGIIDSEEQNPEWTYLERGIYSVKLTVSNSVHSNTILKKDYITALSESPLITSIIDVPNDQGGMVEIQFIKSFYDTDSLVLLKSMSPELYTVEAKTGTYWTAVGSTVAYGKFSYSVLVPTTIDSTLESDGLIKFRIIAGMEEGNFVSEEEIGYSIDNIRPSIPTGLLANIFEDNKVELFWDEVIDNDLKFYKIYRNDENYFDNNSQPLSQVISATYIDNQLDSGSTYYSIKSVDYSGNESEFSEVSSVVLTSALETQNNIPNTYYLFQNYPNPFNPNTIITYSLPNNSDVLIKIYDLLGNEVSVLVNDNKNIGKYEIKFDGSSLSSGVYYYKMQAGNYSQTRKLILLK